MNKKSAILLRTIAEKSKEEILPNLGLVLNSYDWDEESDITIRKLAPVLKFTEKNCEIIVSELMSGGYLKNSDDFIGPNTVLEISQKGIDFFKYPSTQSGTMSVNQALETHLWHRIGYHRTISKDKWQPMGSVCKKCGIYTSQFKVDPKPCTKK